jgi:molybdopterin-guanine dinucleotide biosynthesis protein A
MINLDCVILSGGKSSRMGRDKALLPFGGFDSLCEFQYKRLKPFFKNVYVSAKISPPFEADFLQDVSLEIFSAAYAIFDILKTLQKSIFVLSVDTPFVDEEIVGKLFTASNNKTISVVAKSPSKLHPLCAIYTTDALKVLEKMILANDCKLQNLIKQLLHIEVCFPSDDPFFNINKPEDYENAKQKLSFNY